jgi:hypothetical protein
MQDRYKSTSSGALNISRANPEMKITRLESKQKVLKNISVDKMQSTI